MNRPQTNNWIAYSLVGVSIIFYGSRLYLFTKRHAVNILYYDQWDFLTPLFSSPSIWEMFTRQHGPHRQGLGLFISQAVGAMTNWDTRAESFVIWFILILTAFIALFLKRRLFGKLTGWDALIPAIILSYTQIETIVVTPNPAHGALPLLLIIIAALILTLENNYLKYFGLVFITFFTTYTGFGFFLGLATPILLAIIILKHWRNHERKPLLIVGIALSASIISTASFFLNYTFTFVQDCYFSPFSRILEYFSFITLELSTFLGFCCMNTISFATVSGTFLLLILLIFLFIQVWQFREDKTLRNTNSIIFLFITFSLLFAVNSTSGRICNGLAGAQSSRYVPLLIPGMLGIYFGAQTLSKKYWRLALNSTLVILFVLFPVRGARDFERNMSLFSDVKRNWVACYLEKEDIKECDKLAGNVIYPDPEITHLKEKLEMLKEKKYNLFNAK